MTYDDLKQEFRLTNDGDSWGNAMSWLFAMADEIYFHRDFEVPTKWQFRPSPLGPDTEERYETEIIKETKDAELIKFADLIYRYETALRHAGESY